jgi:hypothetical protein
VRLGQVFANAPTPSFAAPVLEIAQAQEDQPGRGGLGNPAFLGHLNGKKHSKTVQYSTTGGFTS